MSRRSQSGYGENGPDLIRRGMFRGLNPVVTTAASALVGTWLLMGAVWTDTTNRVLSVARDLVGPVLEWHYVLLAVFLLGFVLWLGLGRYREIRLGGDDECPEFSFPSWVAMLFAAGTGVGLIFWSIAEPVLHFQGNPFTSQSGTPESAAAGLRLALFHWGWWFAWSPFVGMFIARISRGRTLREFVFGVLLFPTVFSLLWIGLLGGSALHNELYGSGGIADAVGSDVTVALYRTIELVGYPDQSR